MKSSIAESVLFYGLLFVGRLAMLWLSMEAACGWC